MRMFDLYSVLLHYDPGYYGCAQLFVTPKSNKSYTLLESISESIYSYPSIRPSIVK